MKKWRLHNTENYSKIRKKNTTDSSTLALFAPPSGQRQKRFGIFSSLFCYTDPICTIITPKATEQKGGKEKL